MPRGASCLQFQCTYELIKSNLVFLLELINALLEGLLVRLRRFCCGGSYGSSSGRGRSSGSVGVGRHVEVPKRECGSEM
jgi:hypothetical protein